MRPIILLKKKQLSGNEKKVHRYRTTCHLIFLGIYFFWSKEMFNYNCSTNILHKMFNLFLIEWHHVHIGGTASVAMIKNNGFWVGISMKTAAALEKAGPSCSFSLKVDIQTSKATSIIFFPATILFRLLNLLNFSYKNKAKCGILVYFLSVGGCVIDSAHFDNSSNFLSAIDFLSVDFFRGGLFSKIKIEHSRSLLVDPMLFIFFSEIRTGPKSWS